jgi:nicotinamide-nucleotide amidase
MHARSSADRGRGQEGSRVPEDPTSALPAAAVITVGTELTSGLAEDTNGGVVSRELLAHGFEPRVRELVPDDRFLLASRIRDLISRYAVVVVTGGLGPTHDDVTREAAADALDLVLERDRTLAARLGDVVARHAHPGAASQVLRQADVLAGARVLSPTIGTAPGQLVRSPAGYLLLLPGPPREMRPMLAEALGILTGGSGQARRVRVLGCVDIPESDAPTGSRIGSGRTPRCGSHRARTPLPDHHRALR